MKVREILDVSTETRYFRYSVAWYPIYRIPDDNFRAAFLTYHSLGHFVRQSFESDSSGVGSCVVSPVVGLQSYNAQVFLVIVLVMLELLVAIIGAVLIVFEISIRNLICSFKSAATL